MNSGLEKLRELTNELLSRDTTITRADLNVIKILTEELIIKEDMLSHQMQLIDSILFHALGLIVISSAEKILSASKSYLNQFGYTLDELKCMSWQKMIHPDDLERAKERRVKLMNKTSSAKETLFFQVRVVCKNGEYKRTQWTSVIDGTTSTSLSIGIVL